MHPGGRIKVNFFGMRDDVRSRWEHAFKQRTEISLVRNDHPKISREASFNETPGRLQYFHLGRSKKEHFLLLLSNMEFLHSINK